MKTASVILNIVSIILSLGIILCIILERRNNACADEEQED